MIDVNKAAFLNLIEECSKYIDIQILEGKRFIKSDEEEKEWIKNAKISEQLVLTPDIRLVQITYEENIYVIIVGATFRDLSSIDDLVIEEIDNNAGILTLLLAERYLKIYKRANHLEFYDNILFQDKDKDYKGHDFEELLNYLEPIKVFKLTRNSVIKSNILSRTACYFFSVNKEELILDFQPDVTHLIMELSLLGSESISYKLIINCLFSTTYRHAFLELYRLIERLFPINYLKEFHAKSNTKLDFLDFASELENVTNWRPKESDAVEKLFDNSKLNTRKYFEDFQNSSDKFKGEKIATFFYRLRNSIVHFRANHEEIQLNSIEWNMLLLATLYLIDDHYSINHNILH